MNNTEKLTTQELVISYVLIAIASFIFGHWVWLFNENGYIKKEIQLKSKEYVILKCKTTESATYDSTYNVCLKGNKIIFSLKDFE